MTTTSTKDVQDTFARLSSVFARTRLEANNRTTFRARDRFTKELASVDGTALAFLAGQFPRCSMAVVRNALGAFDSHLLPAYAALYAIENEIPRYDFGGWVPSVTMRLLNRRKRKSSVFDITDDRWTAVQRRELQQIQQRLVGKEKSTSQRSKKASGERTSVKVVKCPICFDDYPVEQTISCQAPDDVPGVSAVHAFCHNCIHGLAKEAAEGAGRVDVLGIPCVVENCVNIIYWNEIRGLLPESLRRRLSDIIQTENLRVIGLQIESCKICGLSGVPEKPKEEDPVFRCPNCGGQHCRLCGENWTEEHQGKRCDEVQESALRRYQERLTEAVVRVCKHCGLRYEKSDGCNRVICRCGATYCYLCRKENVRYDHFCVHTTEATPNKCKACNKTCRLWATPTKFIGREVAMIKEEALRDPRIADQISPLDKTFENHVWDS